MTQVASHLPLVVTPGSAGGAPSDAIVLFDGSSLDAWVDMSGQPASWEIAGGEVTVAPGTGDIRTRESFGSCQLHVEWAAPAELESEGQGRGNSGVFLMDRYEIQVLDSYENPTYFGGSAGSLYKQYDPLANAMSRPGEYNSYDIVFHAPEFHENDGVRTPARLTLLHNGVLVHDAITVLGTTTHEGPPAYEAHGPAPIRLQDHGNRVRFRNIWLRRL